MALARVGGLLLIVGSVAVGIWAIAFSGAAAPAGSAGQGEVRSDTLLVTAFALLLGAGAGAVGIAAPPPFGSRLTRVGLGLIGVGMLSVALGRTVVVIPTGSNELSSLPYLILVFGGGLATIVGSLVCGASLARSPSVGPRIVGLALLAGPLSLPLAAAISLPLHVDASVIVLIGLRLLILSYAGIGILALGAGGTRRGSQA
jgi:hypothetical protein